MQKIKTIMVLFLLCFFSICTHASGSDIYIYKLTGDQFFLMPDALSKDQAQQLRVMELIEENSVVKAENDTIAFLTCPDCDIVKITKKNSPFKVVPELFKKKQSKSKIILTQFTAALKDFIYPDSKVGKRVYMSVRGSDENTFSPKGCQSLSPQDYEDILLIGEEMVFKWDMEGSRFAFTIKNSSNGKLVLKKTTETGAIKIPLSGLKPGFVYSWSVEAVDKGHMCQASFSILSKQDTDEIIQNLEDISGLLPDNADDETKIRLKSGYLLSEGFVYNAFRFLEANGL